MNVSWKQSSASGLPTEATRKRYTVGPCSSRNRWNGGAPTPVERPGEAFREVRRVVPVGGRGTVASVPCYAPPERATHRVPHRPLPGSGPPRRLGTRRRSEDGGAD